MSPLGARATAPGAHYGVLRAAIAMDFRLQRRYGFWYATAFVIVLWIGVLRLVPESLLGAAMPYLLMADLQFFLFFIAGAVFFEKDERTLFALATTPLRFGHYLTAKLVTMSALAVVTCAVVVAVDYGPRFNPPALLGGVVFMALLMVLAGFITAPLFPSISEWLLPSTLLLAVANVPLVDYSGLYRHPLFSLVPTEGPLLLLGSAFHQVDLPGWQIAYAIGYPSLWIAAGCLLARRVFHRYVITREGGQ
ncbi:fluoroquinolone transporter permease [Nonomuraea sp. B12E4]|uniref:fluoroquinolone export ABC transporter permease subunit n=1 Tax=Nonomuraea sp. B12E4 TaxID=3153564 RepID=UPI00325F5C97